MSFTFHTGENDRDDVRALLELHFAEMRAESPPEACHVLAVEEAQDPALRLFSVRDADGILLGIGALKAIGPGHGEIKSMRIQPAALGRGIGRAMLERLIAEARLMGMDRLSLETGNSPLFEAANRLYLSHEFERCEPFGDYQATAFTHFYTRAI